MAWRDKAAKAQKRVRTTRFFRSYQTEKLRSPSAFDAALFHGFDDLPGYAKSLVRIILDEAVAWRVSTLTRK